MSEIDPAKRETRRQKIRMQKRRRAIALAVAAVLLLVLVFGAVKLIGLIAKPKRGEAANIGPTPPAAEAPLVVKPAPRYYDYTAEVPAGAAVADNYFRSILLIGDARTTGLEQYGYLTGADYLTNDRNLRVDNIETEQFAVEGGTTTLIDRLASKKYDAIYISVGLNELGWVNAEDFSKSYASLIDTILSLAPDSSIYMQSIIPVTASTSGSQTHLTNEKIADYNQRIKDIATGKKVYFLNVADALSGGTGALSASFAASNGFSLTKDGYTKWVEYIKTHVVNKELYS